MHSLILDSGKNASLSSFYLPNILIAAKEKLLSFDVKKIVYLNFYLIFYIHSIDILLKCYFISLAIQFGLSASTGL